jgi:fructan beta-fructosidase
LESAFKPEKDIDVGVWECPDLIELKVENSNESKWVLIQNHDRKAPNGGSGTRYFVGDFDGKTFKHTQNSIWLDSGMDYYAGVTFGNVQDDKKILISWMSNWFYATKVPTEVWRSAMTLPRELSLKKIDRQYILTQKIVDQIKGIEEKGFVKKSAKIPFQTKFDLSQAHICFDIKSQENDLKIELSNSKNEVFKIEIKRNQLITDRKKNRFG